MDCDGVERIIDYKFNDRDLLRKALHQTQNKRLALLGDKVMALILIDSWYQTEGSCSDGSSLLQHAASNEAMAKRAIRTHLKDIVCQQSHPHQSIHGLATDIEAVVGAVWIDCGKDLQTLERVIRQLTWSEINNQPCINCDYAVSISFLRQVQEGHVSK